MKAGIRYSGRIALDEEDLIGTAETRHTEVAIISDAAADDLSSLGGGNTLQGSGNVMVLSLCRGINTRRKSQTACPGAKSHWQQ